MEFFESRIQILRDILIVAVPNASASQQLFPFFNIDEPILARPFVEIAKEKPMDGAETGRGEIIETILIKDHHIGAGLLLSLIHIFLPFFYRKIILGRITLFFCVSAMLMIIKVSSTLSDNTETQAKDIMAGFTAN